MKVIGIVGSRRRNSPKDFKKVEQYFLKEYTPGDWICSGGCSKGGDRFAVLLHDKYKTPYLEFPANWEKYGKSAGFRRNTDIAERSDVLIACVSNDRTGGTEDTVKKFRKLKGLTNLIIVR